MCKSTFALYRIASVWVALLLFGIAIAEPTQEQLTFFENEVRPMLATHCYECHSAKSKKLKAGLRVDHINGLVRGGDSGPAIEPGKPDESVLISAIRYEDYEMPPSGKLPAKEIAVLEKWVSIGAPWPKEPEPKPGVAVAAFDWKKRKSEHWCWQPISDPPAPSVNDARWPANEIDHFVLAKLEEKQLTPANDADKRTLARRLYYDLIGLPPTIEQLNKFVEEGSDSAYEELVDELLDSPHYGEKWTRHWLDLVRYGETLGHEFDYPLHHAHQYRDYVIRALNSDVPYDQFVHEHIAGDLLDDPRRHPTEEFNESIIGTGFWYLGEACHAPTDVRQDEADRVDNQIDVFSKTFLGLTVACARCHDHKFDPIPTKDYYALYGYIQSSRRQEALLDPKGKIRHSRETLEQLNERLKRTWQESADSVHAKSDPLRVAIEAELASEDKPIVEALKRPAHPLYALAKLRSADDFSDAVASLQNELNAKTKSAKEKTAKTEKFIDFSKDDFSDWYFTGEAIRETVTEIGDVQAQDQPFVRAGTLHSGLYGKRLQGVLRSPTFVLPAKRVHYKLTAKNARIRLIVDGYTMDEFNALLFNDVEKKKVDTQGTSKWVTQSRDLYHYVGHRAHIEILDHNDGFFALEQIRFSDDENPMDPPHAINLEVLESKPTNLKQLKQAYLVAMQRSLDQFKRGKGNNIDVGTVNWLASRKVIETPKNVAKLNEQIAEADKATPNPKRVIALADGDAEEEYVFVRGSHKVEGETAPRRLLVAIAGEDQPVDPQHSGRLDLARKLTDPSNQLTARVAVNRLWHHLFGRGIVPTVDDFGEMGQLPSHPELLDWLAHDFMTGKGWSLKKAIKQIVMSRTYRMSSTPNASREQTAVVDPENVYLHRAPVRRLAGEAIRDTLLQLSGRLDRKLFGPSVHLHLTSFMEGRGRPGRNGPRDGDGRRSLYVEVRRNFLWPMMIAFDRPSPFSTMGRRSVSNVPAQSLMLMNDPFVIEQATKWSEKIRSAEQDTDERIRLAFEMAFARPPSPAQLTQCREFLASESDEAKSWSDLCHILINYKPFIYVN